MTPLTGHRLHLSPQFAQRLAAISTAVVAVPAAITILILTGALRFNPNDPLAQVLSAQHDVEYTIPGPVLNAIYLGFTTLAFAVVGVVGTLLLFVAERVLGRKCRLRRRAATWRTYESQQRSRLAGKHWSDNAVC
jgi:hypothetical protein